MLEVRCLGRTSEDQAKTELGCGIAKTQETHTKREDANPETALELPLAHGEEHGVAESGEAEAVLAGDDYSIKVLAGLRTPLLQGLTGSGDGCVAALGCSLQECVGGGGHVLVDGLHAEGAEVHHLPAVHDGNLVALGQELYPEEKQEGNGLVGLNASKGRGDSAKE
jgi:hypothetical protein